jgi:hypothetical protein
MDRRRWPSRLFGREAVVILSVLLLVDAVMLPPTSRCSLGGSPPKAPFDPPGHPLVRRDGVIVLADDTSQGSGGVVYAFVRRGFGPSFWAPTNRTWNVQLVAQMNDGAQLSAAENIAIGTQLAAQWREQGDATAARLLSAGGGSVSQPWRRGYVHNALAAVLALWLLAAAGLSTASVFRQRRIHRWLLANRCVRCGYSLEGVEGGTCPECGDSTRCLE